MLLIVLIIEVRLALLAMRKTATEPVSVVQ